MNQKLIVTSAAVLLLMGAAAAIGSYATRESLTPKPAANAGAMPSKNYSQKTASAQPERPPCNDKNIVGTVAGGVGGGLIGSQIGKGSGNTAAIIGGVAGGALLGNQYIPTRGVTCRD